MNPETQDFILKNYYFHLDFCELINNFVNIFHEGLRNLDLLNALNLTSLKSFLFLFSARFSENKKQQAICSSTHL